MSDVAPTLVASRTALPPEGAELRLGRPGASFVAPTLVASRTALPPGGVAAPAARRSRFRGPCWLTRTADRRTQAKIRRFRRLFEYAS